MYTRGQSADYLQYSGKEHVREYICVALLTYLAHDLILDHPNTCVGGAPKMIGAISRAEIPQENLNIGSTQIFPVGQLLGRLLGWRGC